MATSRTATGVWKQRKAQRIALAKAQGQTRCARPGCGKWLNYNTHGEHDSAEVNHDEPFVVTQEIAPPLEKLSVWCRECNGKDGAETSHARRGVGEALKVSREW